MGAQSLSIVLFSMFILKTEAYLYVKEESVIFPMRYVDRSIDRRSSSDTDFNIPTGKCDDIKNRYRNDLVLFLPRSCPPRSLYSGFISSDRVSCLSLRESLVESTPYGSFDRLPNLHYLDLAKNRIQLCDLLAFGGHPSLVTLIVDENGDGVASDREWTIDRADYFPRLENLYLRNNRLRHLKFSLAQNFPSLTHLYLSDNLLTGNSLAEDLTDLPTSLTHLHLENNKIRRVDSSRWLRNLRYLFLDGNAIGSICSMSDRQRTIGCVELRGARELRYLSLSRNEITWIDRDSFVDAWNLRSLNLAENRLETIPIGTFDRLPSLEDLSLSNNRLRLIPDFRQTPMLTSLILNENNIEIIRAEAFESLDRLKWLSLSKNRIRLVEPGAFRNLRALEELDLSENEILRLPWTWIDCSPLRLLDIRGNRLSSYDDLNLPNLASLTDLYVQGNPIASLHVSSTRFYSRNVTVHAHYNNPLAHDVRPCYVTYCDLQSRLAFYEEN